MLFYQEPQLRKLWRNVMFTAIRDVMLTTKSAEYFLTGLVKSILKAIRMCYLLYWNQIVTNAKHYGDHTLQFEDEYWHLVI